MAAVAYDELKEMQEKAEELYGSKRQPGLSAAKLPQGGWKLAERLLVGLARLAWPLFRLVRSTVKTEPRPN